MKAQACSSRGLNRPLTVIAYQLLARRAEFEFVSSISAGLLTVLVDFRPQTIQVTLPQSADGDSDCASLRPSSAPNL